MSELKKPWVSFCMSTYMRPGFLKHTLHSILQQTFTDFEVIVSDNDPQNSAEAVIAEINDPRIKYFSNGGNLGMIKSFNKSIERADATFIAMITDDDPVYPEMLQTLYDLYIQHPGYGVYHGGSDLICDTALLAKTLNLKVGTNSCLSSDQAIGEVATYSADDFPHYFFKDKISKHLLWSVGVVKKEILLEIGGIPDYGSPYIGDFCYSVLTCSHSGVAIINTSLGCQVIHGANFGYAKYSDFESLYITPEGFNKWLFERMRKRSDWNLLQEEIHTFVGRWMVSHCLLIRRYLTILKLPDAEFKKVVKRIYKIPYLRKWKWKYYIASHFPILFRFLLELKSRYMGDRK